MDDSEDSLRCQQLNANTELVKHAAAIRVGNRMSLICRRIWNVLLYHAYPDLLVREIHSMPVAQLGLDVGYSGRNRGWLKQAFRELNSTEIEWDILAGEQSRWGVSSALASAEIHDGRICEWSYAAPMRREFFRPEIYARLNLEIQKNFRSSNSLALWEFFNLNMRDRDTANVRLSLIDFRTLLDIKPSQYSKFRVLSEKVINRSLSELNAVSDVSVSVQYIKSSRQVTGLEFNVERKRTLGSTEFEKPDDTLINRLSHDFGLSEKDAAMFAAKFKNQERLSGLLVDIHKKYEAGKIQEGKLTAYTHATLSRASPAIPEIEVAAQSARKAATGPKLSNVELMEIGRDYYAGLDADKHEFMERAWVKTHGVGVTGIWYRERGLEDPTVNTEFMIWLGDWAVKHQKTVRPTKQPAAFP